MLTTTSGIKVKVNFPLESGYETLGSSECFVALAQKTRVFYEQVISLTNENISLFHIRKTNAKLGLVDYDNSVKFL